MRDLSTAPRDARVSINRIVPSLLGWQTFSRAYATLLLFVLTACGGEWLVHQSNYRLQYGARFSSVMANSPHRYYMTPLGLLFGLVAVGFLIAVAATLYVYAVRRDHLLSFLPERFRRAAPHVHLSLSPGDIALTALTLASLQSLIYLIQENLEAAAQSGTFPLLAVLSPALHPAVLPLQMAMALCLSLILWTLSAAFTASSAGLQAAEILAGLAAASGFRRLDTVLQFLILPRRLRPVLCRPRAPPLTA